MWGGRAVRPRPAESTTSALQTFDSPRADPPPGRAVTADPDEPQPKGRGEHASKAREPFRRTPGLLRLHDSDATPCPAGNTA